MTYKAYKKLFNQAYSFLGELGTGAEIIDNPELCAAYEHANKCLDSIEELGVRLGYLDLSTNCLKGA